MGGAGVRRPQEFGDQWRLVSCVGESPKGALVREAQGSSNITRGVVLWCTNCSPTPIPTGLLAPLQTVSMP